MSKNAKHAEKPKGHQKKDQSGKGKHREEDPNINKHAKESGEKKHNDIEQDNES